MSSTPFLPYGRQTIEDDDIKAVVDALTSDWLTTGPRVSSFEQAVCDITGASYGVAVNSGTAALHAAVHALGLSAGDEVIVPAMTFAATSNSVLYCGATPVFADVYPHNLLIDIESAASKITAKTKAIIAVDYAGQPCDWNALRALAKEHDLFLIADACHALGAMYEDAYVGTLADVTIFSFHPVKHITTGEGGMAVTNSKELADVMRAFRSHGITTDARQREEEGAWFYQMTELGFNYRITDIQCALGISQLAKLEGWVAKRNELAAMYDAKLADIKATPLVTVDSVRNAYHLYVVRVDDRDAVFKQMRAQGIGANVHYIPVYLHPYYQQLGYERGLCPQAEEAYRQIISLPMWPGMDESDVDRVVAVFND